MTNHHPTGDTVRAILSHYTPPTPEPKPPSADAGPFADYVAQAAKDFADFATMTRDELRETWADIKREAGMLANGPQGRQATKRARQPRLIDGEQEGAV